MTTKNSPGIGFRTVTENDIEFLYRVYASTRAEEMALAGWPPKEAEDFLRMQFRLQHTQYMENYKPNAVFDIILVDGQPAGRLYVFRSSAEIRIIDLALLTEFRGNGIGSRILSTLIDEANQKKLPLSLHVEFNNPAMRLYERLGFVRQELLGVYYLMVKPVI